MKLWSSEFWIIFPPNFHVFWNKLLSEENYCKEYLKKYYKLNINFQKEWKLGCENRLLLVYMQESRYLRVVEFGKNKNFENLFGSHKPKYIYIYIYRLEKRSGSHKIM
jgi:hypothetical protein